MAVNGPGLAAPFSTPAAIPTTIRGHLAGSGPSDDLYRTNSLDSGHLADRFSRQRQDDRAQPRLEAARHGDNRPAELKLDMLFVTKEDWRGRRRDAKMLLTA